MRVEPQNIHEHFAGCQTLVCTDSKDARRLISHFITRSYWFHFFAREGEYYITCADTVDLDHTRRRVGALFRVDV